MKLLIASDIHGSAYYMKQLAVRIEAEGPDRILLLGDLLYHGPRNDLPRDYAPKAVIPMLNALKDRVTAVRGNCEAEVDAMVLEFPCMADYATLLLPDGHTIYATHGHHQNPEALPSLAGGTAFLFGHTHKRLLERRDGILLLNPGSVSIPKDGTHSYMTLDKGIFTVRELETGEAVDSLGFAE